MKIEPNNLHHLTLPGGGKYKVSGLEEAYDFCRKIALSHYENFPVGSIFIPKKYRKYFFSVYAFSRIADDISDEIVHSEKKLKLELLDNLDSMIESDNITGNPVLMALKDTMKERNIPPEPLHNLITAFKMDSDFVHPQDFDEILNYCIYSANPVGEIVLRIFGLYNETTARQSDNICTGLQHANFWQDISVDSGKNRIYIPKNILNKYAISSQDIINKKNSVNFALCLKEIYDYTDKFFILGDGITDNLKYFRLKLEISAVMEGGKAIMTKVRDKGIDIIRERPKLERKDFVLILMRAFKNIF